MTVRIVTDSASDIPGETARQLGVVVVAQNVHFGTQTFKDNVTSYTDNDVTAGIQHVYRVKAVNAAGAGEQSNYVNVTPEERRQPAQNAPATGAPGITGTARVGETLTADTSGIADADGLDHATFIYQWLADGADIIGTTGSTYTLADADAGKAVRVRVSFTDDAGNAETLTRAATAGAEAAPTPNSPATGAPAVTGTAQVGETLTADTSGIADADGLDNATFSYQWLADGAEIEGATDSGYTLADADVGQAVKVRVSFTDDRGNEETLTSADTAAVEAVVAEEAEPAEPPPAPTNLTAVVNGDRSVTLTWEAPGDDSVTGYRILRRRPSEGENALLVYVGDTGSTATSYTDNDVTAGIQHVYRVKAVNAAGAGEQSNYVNVTPEERRQPAQNAPATGAPTITGTAQVGETLTADTSDIADEDGLDNATFSYQWLADGADIEGASGSSYTLADADEGKTVKVKVSFTDDAGNGETLTSAATVAIEAAVAEEEPVEPPPAPTNLTAVVNEDGSVTLTWEAPDDDSVTGYLILRRRPYEGEKTLLVYVENTGSTATTFTDADVTAGTQHVYRVKAINDAGVGGQSNYVNVDP